MYTPKTLRRKGVHQIPIPKGPAIKTGGAIKMPKAPKMPKYGSFPPGHVY